MLGKLLPREKYCTKSVFYFLCILRFCLLSLEIKSLPIYFCCPLSLCRHIMQWWLFMWHTGLCHVSGIGINEVYYHKNLGHYLSLLQILYFQKKPDAVFHTQHVSNYIQHIPLSFFLQCVYVSREKNCSNGTRTFFCERLAQCSIFRLNWLFFTKVSKLRMLGV